MAEWRQPLYVAQQLGHAPAVLLNTYAHLLPELAQAERVEPELEIAKAASRVTASHIQNRLSEIGQRHMAGRMYVLSTLRPCSDLDRASGDDTKMAGMQAFQ